MTLLSTSGARSEAGEGRFAVRFKRSYSLIQALGVLLILIVIMQIVNERFLSPANVSNLLGQMTVMLIVAAGMTIVMISGEFDVSVGSVVGLSAAVGGWIMVRWIPAPSSAHHSWWVIALGLMPLFVGPLLGLIVGVIVTKAKIPSFIVTLGTLMMARSLTLVVTRGQPIPDMPQGVAWFGQGRWAQIPLPVNFTGWPKSGESLIVWFPVQNIVWIAVLVYAVGWFVLERTTFGKRVYAVGANQNVAMLSGIRTDWVKIQSLMIVGFTASLAGVVSLSRLGGVAQYGRGPGIRGHRGRRHRRHWPLWRPGEDSAHHHRRGHHCAHAQFPQSRPHRDFLAGLRHRLDHTRRRPA
jgi:ribose/xylose/arabinose/galactoside ABC-type transport system permease subunit